MALLARPNFRALSLIMLMFFGISAAKAWGRTPFSMPAHSSLTFSGVTFDGSRECDVTVSTDPASRVVFLSMSGTFSGRGLAVPSTMQPIPGGYEGVVSFFKGTPSDEVTYDLHVFQPGMTLSWSSKTFPPLVKEAKFYGKDMRHTSRIVYREQGPFLRLLGECRDLSLKIEKSLVL